MGTSIIAYAQQTNFYVPLIFRYKDGVPIQKNSTCYRMSDFSLAITDVQEKNSGVFTISLGNRAKGLYRNLSYVLEVTGKPLPQT